MLFKRTIPAILKLNRLILNKNNRSFSLIFRTNRPVFTVFQCKPLGLRRLTTDSTSSTSSSNTNFEARTGSTKESTSTSFETEQNEQTSDESIETIILKHAMKYVPEFGFTEEAISRGVTECGLSAASKGILQNGAFDLIDFFYKKCNADLAVHLESLIKEGKVTKKTALIRTALIYRLKLIQPYIKHWPNAMAVMSFYPSYAFKSIENLTKLCDEIWYQVGDTSTDWNWYSKRFSLAAVYKSTELFMIQDKSEGFQDTIRFLDNRFDDLNKFNQINRSVIVVYYHKP